MYNINILTKAFDFVNEMDEARRAPSYATQAELDELNDLQRKFKKQMNSAIYVVHCTLFRLFES